MRSLTVAELDRNAQIAFNLRRLRAEKGVSQAELAKAIGNSQAFVAMIESGARTLSAPMCMDIAKALGQIIRQKLSGKRPLVAVDAVKAEFNNFVDFGRPIMNGLVIPVIVKTLIFG